LALISDLMSKLTLLWCMLVVQGLCALFFLFDALSDWIAAFQAIAILDTRVFEVLIVLALLLGTLFSAFEIRRLMRRQKRMVQQLQAASGAFSLLLEEHFDLWGLTPSERDVALLAIKGLSIAEIAGMRNTKDGTIKAQCNAIYRKAGVSGRLQLLSLFVEELMAGSLKPQGVGKGP
jgi:DNA-binding CsgD family transcriptional regulator